MSNSNGWTKPSEEMPTERKRLIILFQPGAWERMWAAYWDGAEFQMRGESTCKENVYWWRYAPALPEE